MPEFVKAEFDAFLEIGVLAHGFLRQRCSDCAHETLAAFLPARIPRRALWRAGSIYPGGLPPKPRPSAVSGLIGLPERHSRQRSGWPKLCPSTRQEPPTRHHHLTTAPINIAIEPSPLWHYIDGSRKKGFESTIRKISVRRALRVWIAPFPASDTGIPARGWLFFEPIQCFSAHFGRHVTGHVVSGRRTQIAMELLQCARSTWKIHVYLENFASR